MAGLPPAGEGESVADGDHGDVDAPVGADSPGCPSPPSRVDRQRKGGQLGGHESAMQASRRRLSLPEFQGKYAVLAALVYRRASSGLLTRLAYCSLVNFGSFTWL